MGAIFPKGQSVLLLWIQTLLFLFPLKLFSIRVKELFVPILVLWKIVDGFLLFLKAFSCNNDLWVTLGDFTVKTQNLEESVFNLSHFGMY